MGPHRLSTALFIAVLAVYTAIYLRSGVPDPGEADGHYAFLYARSVAFDGDLDFRNDYAVCGDRWDQGIDRGTGRVDNPAYPGPALIWIPMLATARVFMRVAPDASAAVRAGCSGPMARFALAVAMPLGALAILLSYFAARRFAEREAAFMAAVLFAFASSLPQYASVFVSSSHVFECVFAALCVWLSLRAVDNRESSGQATRSWPWVLVALSLVALTLQRISDACFVFIPLSLIVGSTLSRRRKLTASAAVLGGVTLGVSAVLALYAYLYGSPWMLPQGRHYVHLAHAHPFLLLFAPQGGLLYATPSAYLALLGLALALRDTRYRRFALSTVIVIALCLWIASSVLDWHAKATFGARRLVVLTPLFVVFAARALQAGFERIPARAGELAGIAAGVILLGLSVPVLGAVIGTTSGRTPLQQAPLQVLAAGRAYRAMAAIGDAAILPAKLFYTARFRLPSRSIGFATLDLFYRRSYRDLSWEPHTLLFSSEALREASRGTEPRGGGLALTAPEAFVVFTAGWPFADTARLDVSATAASTIALSIATTWRRCDLGERRLDTGRNTVSFTIPAGCFNSGLVELGFRSAPAAGAILERLTLDDTRALPPPF